MSQQPVPLSSYLFHQRHQTRWSDNDQYSHVNNSIYYHLFDSIVNTYLIQHCGLVPNKSERIGLVVQSFCEFMSPLSFPQPLVLGLRVTKLGRSSVTYEVGVFEDDPNSSTHREGASPASKLAAVGGYTHVFVDSTSRKSVEIPAEMRAGLEKLVRPESKL
jgi:acyl-CoA thioester hydrolase